LPFSGGAQREAHVVAIQVRGRRVFDALVQPGQFLVGEAIGLEVGQAPERVAEVRLDPVGRSIGFDGLVHPADRFQRMPARQVGLREAGLALNDPVVRLQCRVEVAHRHVLVGKGQLESVIVRIGIEQDPGLFQSLFELLPLVQDVDVVVAGQPVVGLEFDAALQQELRIVIDEQLHAQQRQQPHGLDMVGMLLQEGAAQLLRPEQLALLDQAGDADQFGRQAGQTRVFGLRDLVLPLIVVPFVQRGQFTPGGHQGMVQIDRALIGDDSTPEIAHQPQVVALFLICPGMRWLRGIQALQGLERGAVLIEITVEHRLEIQGLDVLRMLLQGRLRQFQCLREAPGFQQFLSPAQALVGLGGRCGLVGHRHRSDRSARAAQAVAGARSA
jgi:hypothetical protein